MTTLPQSAVAASLLVLLALVTPARAEGPKVGALVPYFALYNSQRTALVSLSDLVAYPRRPRPTSHRKAVVVDFFRTDCPPCRKGLPKLVQLHERYASRPVEVLLVALLEEDEGERKLRAFLASSRLPFRVLVDSYGVVAKKYVAKGSGIQIPQIFVVDGRGRLRQRISMIDKDTEGELVKLLDGLAR